ncbi:MAG: HAMP domain-containing histidine kinase [Gemmatimonadota bacterium]|nr:HAMP domain-containing histidine kinase [Gemmatimonadota bacterium]MDH5759848.1 HAMP domain-containing histidine kinase [Gemmatimonadota bacterium]
MSRSFRFQLALRAMMAMAVGLATVAFVTFLTVRSILDGELDASILNVASIQAASLTDAPSGAMHFHEWELTPDEATSLQDLIRYAQVWQADGVSLLRNQYMTSDLPLNREHLARAADGTLVWTRTSWNGMPIRTLYYPLERFGMVHERHVLEVAAPLTARNEMLTRVGLFLLALTVVMSASTFVGASWLAGRAMRPVNEVIDQAEAIRAGSLDRRIHAYAEVREYRRLVDVLNTMLSRIQGAFDAQRRFTADASHELRSPLTVMRGELELALRRERSPEEYRRVLESTLEEVVRLSRIGEDLLVLARSDSGALRPRIEAASLSEVTTRVADRLRGAAAEKGIVMEIAEADDATGRFDPGLVGQVVWNLVDNALKYTPREGRVDVLVRRDGEDLVLSIEDTGPGFQDPDQAFRRFFREDAARTHRTPEEGTGLGLAIVEAVTEAHGGSVSVRNLPAGGASVVVRIPADPPEGA